MNKQLLVFTFLLLLIPIACKDIKRKQDIEGYLQAKWGMSKKEIKQLTELQLTDELDDILMFSDVIDEDNVTRIYMFDKEDKLFGVMIVYELPNQDEYLFRNKFRKTYNALAFKYRDADEYVDEELGKNGLSATWKFKTSIILLQMKIKKPFNMLALATLYLNTNYAEQYFKTYPTDKY